VLASCRRLRSSGLDECLIPSPARATICVMNKLSAGAVFMICLFIGIFFDNVALGILAGLFLGAGLARRRAASGLIRPHHRTRAPKPDSASIAGHSLARTFIGPNSHRTRASCACQS